MRSATGRRQDPPNKKRRTLQRPPGAGTRAEAVVGNQPADQNSVPDGSPVWHVSLPEHGGHRLAPAVDAGLGDFDVMWSLTVMRELFAMDAG